MAIEGALVMFAARTCPRVWPLHPLAPGPAVVLSDCSAFIKLRAVVGSRVVNGGLHFFDVFDFKIIR